MMEKINPYTSVRNCWYVVGMSNEFEPGKLNGHKIANRRMVIWRTEDGEIAALDDRCCHKRFPLSEGRLLADGTLECAYHGLCYNTKGKCVKIPAQEDIVPPQAKVPQIPVIEQDGMVWIWPGDPARCEDRSPPRMPEVVDDEWESVVVGPVEVPANYLLLIENLLDITHFYPLHEGNIGDYENSQLPVQMDEGEIDGNMFIKNTRFAENYKQPPYLVDWFHHEVVDRLHTHCAIGPAFTRVEMHVAPPGKLETEEERGYILMHAHAPIDDRNLVWRVIVNCKAKHMSKGDPKMSAAKRVASMFPSVLEEDQWALEKQQEMFELPEDGYSELFLRTDKALRRARNIFVTMLREERELEAQSKTAAE
jgi:phenylpropionate dioxygenase-like ring-hydroxylating dioxygenase large terminal subunit